MEKNNTEKKKYFSVSAYAKRIGKTTVTVYNYIKDNRIDYITVSFGKKNGYVIVESSNE